MTRRAPRGIRSPAPWRPILSGPRQKQALTSVRRIAEDLCDLAPRAGEAQPTIREGGLLTGRAGIAIFFGYLHRADLFPDAATMAIRFLGSAEDGLGRAGMTTSLSEGIAGIAWAHTHLHHRLLGRRDSGSLKAIDEVFLGLLERWQWPQEFDLLYGLVGIGVYAFERLPNRRSRSMIRSLINRLEESAEPSPEGITWRGPPELAPPAGPWCLGMAHGIPGVIGFLARAALAGVEPRRARALAGAAVSWLLARQLPAGSAGAFAGFAAPGNPPSEAARLAWCHGDPGVGAALLSAAAALDRPELRRLSLDFLRAASHRPVQSSGVTDAGLCHGAAGLAHSDNRLYQLTGDPTFRRSAHRWIERTLAYQRVGRGIGGYTTRRGPSREAHEDVIDAGILSGSAGIGLALLAAATPIAPLWDRALMLDQPPQS